MALITTADLEKYPLPATADLNAPIVDVLINSASAAVTDAAGSPILQRRSTVTLLAGRARLLRLPGLPVREIHTVTVDGQPVTGWHQAAGGIYLATGFSDRSITPVTVDYTHGLTELPADIKDLVCRMVISSLIVAQSDDEEPYLTIDNGRLSSVAIDDYKEGYATGDTVDAITEMDLPQRTKDWLAKRFGNSGAKVVGGL
ncbi:hypothetical protein [Glutamicibacter sp. PS]|uniref:hypothetical protein n=1 Tax=Glutamicibacter sp. PS TaxID=3075634 RepID=UPI00284BCDFE|nr:hypothetical protein [Glutamicibacter sp. PS]MDR4533216.1 hypothetical protein [Glutamicibacter sp. PS]